MAGESPAMESPPGVVLVPVDTASYCTVPGRRQVKSSLGSMSAPREEGGKASLTSFYIIAREAFGRKSSSWAWHQRSSVSFLKSFLESDEIYIN